MANMKFNEKEREKRKRKEKCSWQQTVIQNITCIALCGRGHYRASNIVVEASIIPSDGGSYATQIALIRLKHWHVYSMH
jgi:hypothetical protein